MKVSLFITLGFLAGAVTPCPGHERPVERRGANLDRRATATPTVSVAASSVAIPSSAPSASASPSTKVKSTVLVLARDADSARQATSGLNGYGIPFEILIIPQGGVSLPTLNTTAGGNYGGIVALSGLAYNCRSPVSKFDMVPFADHIPIRRRQWRCR
jgi:hypothetical protein